MLWIELREAGKEFLVERSFLASQFSKPEVGLPGEDITFLLYIIFIFNLNRYTFTLYSVVVSAVFPQQP